MDVIPSEWVQQVVAILNAGKAHTRAMTNTARLDWMSLFPESYSFEIYTVLARVLTDGSITDARRVDGMAEPGVVYEFLFLYSGRRMYAKVNLCEGRVSVLVYSAHLQRLGNIKDGRFV